MCTPTLVAGPNGSGKSTITSKTSFEGSNCVIDPDAIARHLGPEQPARASIAAARQAVERCRSMVQGRESFVVESTLAGNGAISLLRKAKRSEFRTELIFVALGDPEMYVERVRLRVAQGGHHVPDDDVRRRYWRSLKRPKR